MFCSGGINPADPWHPADNKENGAMRFFRDVVGRGLNRPAAKAAVLVAFAAYLAAAAWGITQLQEGLETKRLSRFDSYSVAYYETEEKYFREYPFRINVSSFFLFIFAKKIKNKPLFLYAICTLLKKCLQRFDKQGSILSIMKQ
jgi:hypothetical protein